jgi:hypothetical protein
VREKLGGLRDGRAGGLTRAMAEPLFIIAPGRSFTSVISTMLGQHPQMYGFLELYLNVADTMAGWWVGCGGGRTNLHHGLLRCVAQLQRGEQTEETIAEAWAWIRSRFRSTTKDVYLELTNKIAPRIAVEKSPFSVHNEQNLERLMHFFPGARVIHLTRHPVSTCESLMKFEPGSNALANIAIGYDFSTNPPTFDPQLWWYDSHLRIKRFAERLPPDRWMRLRGEAFLKEPDQHLRRIAHWLGLREDDAAIDEMKHPERSPFARLGPTSAPYGADHAFFEKPGLVPFHDRALSLDAPLSWRADGRGLLLEARALAREFGYD